MSAAAASSRQQQSRRRATYPYTLERAQAPRLLKDFLREDNQYHSTSSCSSSGFTSLPRFSTSTSFSTGPNINPAKQSLNRPRKTQKSNNEPSLTRSRSRSRAAAEATFSLLQKLINAVVVRRSAAVAAAPRSKKKSLKRVEEKKKAVVAVGGEVGTHVVAAVRVRDILRWKSFRDNGIVVDGCSEEEEGGSISSSSIASEQEASCVRVVLDGSGEIESTAEYRSTTTSCSGDGGGCLDVNAGEEESEEEVPPDYSDWVGTRSGSWGGGCCVGDKVVDAGTAAAYAEVGAATGAKGGDDDEARHEPRTIIEAEDQDDNDDDDDDDDQPSPVSVLDSPFRDDVAADHEHDEEEEEDDDFCFSSNFDRTLANVERTKQRLLDSIKRFETLAGVADQPTTTNITADHDDDDDDDLFSVEEEEEEETTGFCGVVESSHSDADSEENEEDVQQGYCQPSAAAAAATSTPQGSDHRSRTTITFGTSIIIDELPTSTVVEELNPKGGTDELKVVNAAAAKGYDRRGELGGRCRPVGSGVVDAKERRALVREMERQGQWGGFGEEKEGVGCEFEVGLLSDLLDEVVNELVI